MVVCVLYGCCRVEYRNHNCSSFPLESGLLSGFEKIPLPTPSPTPQTGHVKCIHLILDNSYTGYLVGEPWGKVHQPVTGQGRGGEGSIFFSFHGQKKVMVFPSYVKHNTQEQYFVHMISLCEYIHTESSCLLSGGLDLTECIDYCSA